MTALRSAGRLAAGLALVLAGLVACAATLSALGWRSRLAVALSLGCVLLGHAGLALARTPSAPWRPMRLALGIALLLSLSLLSAIRWPPAESSETRNAIATALASAGSLLAIWIAPRAPRFALGLLAALAAYGLFLMARLVRAAPETARGATHGGVAIVVALTLGASLGAAYVAALWHGRALARARAREDASG